MKDIRNWQKVVTDVVSVYHKNFIQKGCGIYGSDLATLIIKGKKTFADVPEKIKDKVKEVLIDLDCPELAE